MLSSALRVARWVASSNHRLLAAFLCVACPSLFVAVATVDDASTMRDGSNDFGVQKKRKVYLGTEIDQCSGVLRVKNKDNQWIRITRGVETEVPVIVNGDGYWRWKCGGSNERSRGGANFRQRVKLLKVSHSTENRQIRWRCYDIVDASQFSAASRER